MRHVPSPSEPLAEVGGVNVHAKVAFDGRDRLRLERLWRYLARPPLAQERLSLHHDGRVRLSFKAPWKDGTHAVLLDPLDLVDVAAPALFGERTRRERPADVARWTREALASTPPATIRAEARAYTRDLRPDLAKIRVQVHLRVGSDDPNVPVHAARAVGAHPGCGAHRHRGAGHALHLEDVEGVASAIRRLAG